MEKRHIDRRLEQMAAEGTTFRAGVDVGVDITAEELRKRFDAVVLAGGATAWRDLAIPGRGIDGITRRWSTCRANRASNGDPVLDADGQPPITAKDKRVIIIGGGDTGRTAWAPRRQGRSASTSSDHAAPPESRAESTRGRPAR